MTLGRLSKVQYIPVSEVVSSVSLKTINFKSYHKLIRHIFEVLFFSFWWSATICTGALVFHSGALWRPSVLHLTKLAIEYKVYGRFVSDYTTQWRSKILHQRRIWTQAPAIARSQALGLLPYTCIARWAGITAFKNTNPFCFHPTRYSNPWSLGCEVSVLTPTPLYR